MAGDDRVDGVERLESLRNSGFPRGAKDTADLEFDACVGDS